MRPLRERKVISYAEDVDEVEAKAIAHAKRESLKAFSFEKQNGRAKEAARATRSKWVYNASGILSAM
jgi:hypothetical protein